MYLLKNLLQNQLKNPNEVAPIKSSSRENKTYVTIIIIKLI